MKSFEILPLAYNRWCGKLIVFEDGFPVWNLYKELACDQSCSKRATIGGSRECTLYASSLKKALKHCLKEHELAESMILL